MSKRAPMTAPSRAGKLRPGYSILASGRRLWNLGLDERRKYLSFIIRELRVAYQAGKKAGRSP